MKNASHIRKSGSLVALVALSAAMVTGCAEAPPNSLDPDPSSGAGPGDYVEDPTEEIAEKPGAYAGGEDNTHDHMGDLSEDGGRDPFDILEQRLEEGPAEIRTRLHSCQKLQNVALRNILQDFGVNMGATGNPRPAGQLFTEGQGALGSANYDGRQGEATVWTSAGAAKFFDIMVQAAPELIANISTVPRCQIDGVGPEMFDDQNRCVADAISCVLGKPASGDHLALCDNLITSATDVEIGKRIAIATLLSAAHQCE